MEARVTELLEEGTRLASRERYEAAAERFNAALVIAPNHSLALLNLASVAQERGRHEQQGANQLDVIERHDREAVELFERALSGTPSLSVELRMQVLIRLGRMHRLLGEHEKSCDALLRVVRDAEAGAQAREAASGELATTHARLLGYPERNLSEAEARRYSTLWKEATSPLQGLLAGDAVRPLSQAEVRRFEAARLLLQQALDLIPENWAAAWTLGMVERRLGNDVRASECFTRAFELNPYNPDVCREASISAGLVGRMEDAVRFSEAALVVGPDDAGLVANLALNLLLAGRAAEALPRAREAVARAPKDPVSRAVLALTEQVASGAMSVEEARRKALSGR
ncbi:tetratricopeptide repeat protein [Corallococcus terminator]|nr:tetratricopeptide repeat protein [Corallococcus terminator]